MLRREGSLTQHRVSHVYGWAVIQLRRVIALFKSEPKHVPLGSAVHLECPWEACKRDVARSGGYHRGICHATIFAVHHGDHVVEGRVSVVDCQRVDRNSWHRTFD